MAEWTLTDQYQVESRTQKEIDKNTDPEDTDFIIADDVVYTFARILDSEGDPVSGVNVDFTQIDPNGGVRGSDSATTGSDGWTPQSGTQGEAFDTRPPANTGWIQRAEVSATHDGNDGTDDQPIRMISPFAANVAPAVAAGPVKGVSNSSTGEVVSEEGHEWIPGDRLLIGFGVINSVGRVAPDPGYTPSMALAHFNQDTSKAEFLQSDGTWKDRDDTGYETYFFDMKVGIEEKTTGEGDYLEYLNNFGTSGQGVSSSNGYVMDTSSWPRSGYIGIFDFQYDGKEFTVAQGVFKTQRTTNSDIGHVFDGVGFATGFGYK